MSSVTNRLASHFAQCTAVVAVVTVATSAASAQIVYSGVQNLNVPADTNGLYLNLITRASGSSGDSVTGWHINPYSPTALQFGTNYPTPDVYFVGLSPATSTFSGGRPVNLTLGSLVQFNGTSVSGASSMNAAYGWSYSFSAAQFGSSAGQWALNSDNYLGVLAFDGTDILKAWVRIRVGAAATDRSIVDWAYEINGGSLAVGAVPAPGAVALLGAAGLLGSRRRRSA